MLVIYFVNFICILLSLMCLISEVNFLVVHNIIYCNFERMKLISRVILPTVSTKRARMVYRIWIYNLTIVRGLKVWMIGFPSFFKPPSYLVTFMHHEELLCKGIDYKSQIITGQTQRIQTRPHTPSTDPTQGNKKKPAV